MNTQAIFAWAILAGSLVFLAEIEATSQLAVAFAYLILLGILLSVGPVALANITALIGQSPATTDGPGANPRGSIAQ